MRNALTALSAVAALGLAVPADACLPGNPPKRMSREIKARASDVLLVRVTEAVQRGRLCEMSGTILSVERGSRYARGESFADRFPCAAGGWIKPPENEAMFSDVPVTGAIGRVYLHKEGRYDGRFVLTTTNGRLHPAAFQSAKPVRVAPCSTPKSS